MRDRGREKGEGREREKNMTDRLISRFFEQICNFFHFSVEFFIQLWIVRMETFDFITSTAEPLEKMIRIC